LGDPEGFGGVGDLGVEAGEGRRGAGQRLSVAVCNVANVFNAVDLLLQKQDGLRDICHMANGVDAVEHDQFLGATSG
jgi:hypothetical protein